MPVFRVPANPDSLTATVHAVALTPHDTIPILDAAESAGFGFRQYADAQGLIDAASPSVVGCVVTSCGTDSLKDQAVLTQVKTHLHSLPLVALLESDSADRAVGLMQQGIYTVIARPFERGKLLTALSMAVAECQATHRTVDHCREASLRMDEATEKEIEVLQLIMQGKKNKEIAGHLGITVRAVEDRRFRLMKKVGVESVAELVALAVSAKYFRQGFSGSHLRSSAARDPRQCVKGIEVWSPAEDGSVLTLRQSCYREAGMFQEASEKLTFHRGEGLPGRVWERRAPVFLRELITTEFVRSSAAGAAGMTTAIGFPVFCNGDVRAVVLILLDGRHQMKAAFEWWRLDPGTANLRLAGGTFINCERLRRLSEFVQLPVGEGIAGIAAEHGRPYVGARFNDDPGAVRGVALAAEGLSSGVALPLTDSGAMTSDVFTMFNSEDTQMFSLLQAWKVNGRGLSLANEYFDGVSSLAAQMAAVTATEVSIAGRAAALGTPIVVDSGSAAQAVSRSVHIPAPSFGIAIPTLVRGRVVAVTVFAN
ncbi:MAG: LuxR C-terminal-related transcriptional regulator [Planctomycetaceae bacterium]